MNTTTQRGSGHLTRRDALRAAAMAGIGLAELETRDRQRDVQPIPIHA